MSLPTVTRDESWRRVVDSLASAQKSNVNAPAYSRWVNRPLGRLFAATAFKLGLTPNAVTSLSGAFSAAGIVILAASSPSFGVGILVALLLVIGYALDSADGQLARLRGGGRPSGEWLDHVIDCAKVASVHLAVLVAWYRHPDDQSSFWLLVPLLFSLQQSVWFFGMVLTDLLMRNAGVRPNRSGPTPDAKALNSLVGLPLDYGLFCLAFLIYGWTPVWKILYVALFLLNVVALLVQLVRWYRRADSLPRTS